MTGGLKRIAAFGLAAFASVAAGAVTGWLGVALLGLLAAFVAFQAQFDAAAPIGGLQTTGLHAESLRPEDRLDRKGKGVRRAEAAAVRWVLRTVKICGGVLAVVGLVGFFLVRLPR